MPPIKIKYPVRVYPQPPLADGNPPAEPEPDEPPPSPRGLQAALVLGCIVAGAWLIQHWLGYDMPLVLYRVRAPFTTTPAMLPCVGAWVLLCAATIVIAWRRTQL